MDSPVFSELQKTLKHKFGQFYFKAKLGKVPKPEDLMVKFGPKGEVETEVRITRFANFKDRSQSGNEGGGSYQEIIVH